MKKDLFVQLSKMTDIPEDIIRQELFSLLEKRSVAPEEMTIDTLREVLLEYLGEVNLSLLVGDSADSAH